MQRERVAHQAGEVGVAHDALLADVRMSARARVPQWNQGPLQRVFGERYVHIKALGNANYKGALGLDAGIVLNQPERGVEWATTALRSQSIILLCACKDYHECHRTTAAELLKNISAAAANQILPQLKVTGPIPGTAWIQPDGDHNLVQARLQPSGGSAVQMTLSDWNKPVTVTKPQI